MKPTAVSYSKWLNEHVKEGMMEAAQQANLNCQ